MLRRVLVGATVLGLSSATSAAELQPSTVAAFDHYVHLTEQRMATELPGSFLRAVLLMAGQCVGRFCCSHVRISPTARNQKVSVTAVHPDSSDT